MTQNKDTSLLDSIQAEVSREASPMLDFLVRHASKIFMLLIAFIVLVIAFGAWNYFSGSKQKEAEEALGKILIMPDTTDKLTALEEFAASGEPKMKNAALLALAQSAAFQNQPEKSAAAWAQVAQGADAPTRLVAGIAQASALSARGKSAEALAILEPLLAGAAPEAQTVINSHIVSAAEAMGDWNKAIAACEAIILQAGSNEAKEMWQQRLTYFTAKK